MKEQTTRTPPKLRILSAFLAVAMLLNLAARGGVCGTGSGERF